jgi:hypothetical protein
MLELKTLFLIALLFAGFAHSDHSHDHPGTYECDTEKCRANPIPKGEVHHEFDEHGRMLATYGPIRIVFDYTFFTFPDQATADYIQQWLIPPTEAYFEKLLQVK